MVEMTQNNMVRNLTKITGANKEFTNTTPHAII